jgi:hypothetical protein
LTQTARATFLKQRSAREQWEQTENKSSIALYAGGSFAAVWLSSAVLGAVNAVPLVRVQRLLPLLPMQPNCRITRGRACGAAALGSAMELASMQESTPGWGLQRLFWLQLQLHSQFSHAAYSLSASSAGVQISCSSSGCAPTFEAILLRGEATAPHN